MPAMVSLDKRGIKIGNEYKVLLCASMFYFRIPEELWRDRMLRLKAAGYNCVDVYFPWNYHENTPGQWNFSGDRDAARFLDMLAEEGLYVIARPGPYICSEWDGGGLPAWILASGMGIRENSQPFMGEVQKWYDRILPVIASHEVGRGGSVILVQLENELDFFDCPGPRSYFDALAAMAKAQGISVPVFGCAGQCEGEKATGFASGVVNTYNFYPKAGDPYFDRKCKMVAQSLAAIDMPLLISETNREHSELRRELASGAKLLGAYNQVGGTNFGFTSSVNNWGMDEYPLSFISSDYDFDSMINAAGEYSEEALEGRLLGSLISTLGESLAAAVSTARDDIKVDCGFRTSRGEPSFLELQGGGLLLCIPNLSDGAGQAHVAGPGFAFTAGIGASKSPFFPIGVPIASTGLAGKIKYSSAEILKMEEGILVLYADSDSEVVLEWDDGSTFTLSSAAKTSLIEHGGKKLSVCILGRQDAARVERDGCWQGKIAGLSKETTPISKGLLKDCKPQWASTPGSGALNMEAHGLYRGYALYEAAATAGKPVLVQGAADIITAYDGDKRLDTRISGGQWQLYEKGGSLRRFIVESWGHSNFSDSRLDSMMLNCPKGITRIFEVIGEKDTAGQWRFVQMEQWLPEKLAYEPNPFHAILNPYAWNSTRKPLIALYYMDVVLPDGCSGIAIRLEGNRAETVVYAGGKLVTVVNPLDPWAYVPASLLQGGQARIELLCRKRVWSEHTGEVTLLHLKQLDAKVYGFSEEQLACLNAVGGAEVSLPARLDGNSLSVLQFDMDGYKHRCAYVRMEAHDLKATVVFNGRVVGRVFGDSENRPTIVGGDSFVFYLPAPWYVDKDNRLVLFVEPMGEAPSLNSLTMEYADLG